MKNRYSAAFAALVLFAAGCGKSTPVAADPHAAEEGGHSEAGHSEDIVLTPEAAKIAGIETGEARMVPMQSELKLSGTVTNTSSGRAVVTSPVEGKIVRFFVKIGDVVKSGQPIVALQSADLARASADIIEAQRGLLAAQSSVREADSEVDLSQGRLRGVTAALARQRELASTGAFSQPALLQAQREMNDAMAELEAAQQEQAVHGAQLERAERLYKQELISRTEVEQARLEVLQDLTKQANARRQIEISRATLDREKEIAQRGLTNSREIQTAEAEVRNAALEVQRATIRRSAAVAAVAGAQKGLQAARLFSNALAGGSRAGGGNLTVSAPIAGVVTRRGTTLGQAIERTTEIAEIENLRSVWVTTNVPEKQAGLAKLGARAQVRVAAYPNRTFAGVVQIVGNRLDAKSRTLPVQILVDNPSGDLRADMFATVSLGVGSNGLALAIPASALVEDGDRQLVYLVEADGKYAETPVVTGRKAGQLVEVLEGLEPGAKVVTRGGFVLKSDKVKAELKGHKD